MARWMVSCRQAASLSSRALEEALAPSERVLLRMHLLMCKGCANFARQLEFLRRASRRLPEALGRDAD